MRFLLQLCMCFMAIACASDAVALGLGKMRVDSFLGQPLEIRIPIENLGDTDVSQLRARIADSSEYRDMGLQFPEGIKFGIHVYAEQTARPYIRVYSQHRVDELFVSLLIEVSTSAGKLLKSYTILPDPPPEIYLPEVVGKGHATAEAGGEVDAIRTTGVAPAPETTLKSEKSAKSGLPRKHRNASKSKHASVQAAPEGKAVASLSISRSDPSEPTQQNNDALQEKLIVTQKRIEELNSQISEMQVLISSMQSRLDAGHAAISAVPAVVGIAANRVLPQLDNIWLKPALALLVLLAAVSGAVWYYRTRRAPDWHYESLDESEVLPPVFDITVADQTQSEIVATPVDEKSLSFTDHAEQSGAYAVPPEYVLLMKAKAFLRAGNVGQAEIVLKQALEKNPNNPHCYLTLLGIYETRGDLKSFAKLAKQLKAISSEQVFKEAAVMGRRLDPDNPLYR